MPLFGKPKYTTVNISKRAKKTDIPSGLWHKCGDCGHIIHNKEFDESLKVCAKCNYHFVIGCRERVNILLDESSFREFDKDMKPVDVLSFKGPKSYKDKIKEDSAATGLNDAVISGDGLIDGKKVVIIVTDSRFIMGTLGSVMGEKITRAAERAMEKKLPLIIVSGSGGGARMYEGMLSLMQMAKTSGILMKLNKSRLPYISVLTNPTMAGVMASFASLGDIIIAEPKALIGFTGPRVIEQTLRQRLPEGFQTSEFLLAHGLIDMIVSRKDMRATLSRLLGYFA